MKTVTRITPVAEPVGQTIKVAAYCRVSTGNDDQLESLTAQKQHYEQMISSRNNWCLAGIYYDEGITGTNIYQRPSLLRLISDCEAHKIDMVLTKSISRLSRNVTDCLYIVRRLKELSIPIFFEKERINTGTLDSELLLSVMSAIAENESEMISQNITWGINNRFRNGTFKLSYPPFGYKWNGTEMIIDKNEATIVKEIFDKYLHGHTITSIVNSLNERGLHPKRSPKWSNNTIIRMLKNEKYTGDVIFQKTYRGPHFKQRTNKHGERDQFYYANHHEAIITKDDFALAQELMKQHRKEKNITSYTTNKRYALSGKIICGECGAYFIRRTHASKTNPYIAWCCKNHISNKSVCSMLFIRNDAIETAFTTMLNKLIFAKDIILKPLVHKIISNSTNDNITRIKELEKMLISLTDKKRQLQDLLGKGFIDSVIFTREQNVLMKNRDDCLTELEALNRDTSSETTALASLKELLYFCNHSNMQTEYNEDLLSRFVSKITVHSRNEIAIELKCGLILKEVLK